jgi:hypothetical protein
MANQPDAGIDPRIVQKVIQDAAIMEQEGQTRVMISRQLFQQLQVALQQFYGNSQQVDKMFEAEQALLMLDSRLTDMIELAVVANFKKASSALRYKIPDYIAPRRVNTAKKGKIGKISRQVEVITGKPGGKPRRAKKATIDDFRDQAPRRKANRARKTDRAARQIEEASKDPSLGFSALEAQLNDAIEFGSGGIAHLGRKAKGLLKKQQRTLKETDRYTHDGQYKPDLGIPTAYGSKPKRKKIARKASDARGEALARRKGRIVSRRDTKPRASQAQRDRQEYVRGFKKRKLGSLREAGLVGDTPTARHSRSKPEYRERRA